MRTRAPWTAQGQQVVTDVRDHCWGDLAPPTPDSGGTPAWAGSPSRPGIAHWACGRRNGVRRAPTPGTGWMSVTRRGRGGRPPASHAAGSRCGGRPDQGCAWSTCSVWSGFSLPSATDFSSGGTGAPFHKFTQAA